LLDWQFSLFAQQKTSACSLSALTSVDQRQSASVKVRTFMVLRVDLYITNNSVAARHANNEHNNTQLFTDCVKNCARLGSPILLSCYERVVMTPVLSSGGCF